jgi:hypothetical protein
VRAVRRDFFSDDQLRRRADLMLEQGDLDGQAVWKRIRRTAMVILISAASVAVSSR